MVSQLCERRESECLGIKVVIHNFLSNESKKGVSNMPPRSRTDFLQPSTRHCITGKIMKGK